jgi:hypothetical protein
MLDSYGEIDAVVTNPPNTRELMHRLIEHFQRIAPTWLLLDSDWASTRQAAPFLPHCSDIVAIGRVKWIEGSKHTGKDNYAWYRFHAGHTTSSIFHGRVVCEGEAIPRARGPPKRKPRSRNGRGIQSKRKSLTKAKAQCHEEIQVATRPESNHRQADHH